MKVLLIIALAGLAYSQDSLPDVVATQCWSGESVGGVGNFTYVQCSFASDSNDTVAMACQTKIESNQGVVRINRGCKASDACENNKANNPSQCYSADAIAKKVRICFFCCQVHQCNNFDDIEVEVVV